MDTKTFNCISCGRKNPVKGASYQNKYCNNQCQQDHRKILLKEKRTSDWQNSKCIYVWKEIPDFVSEYLIKKRGHECEQCKTKIWNSKPVPLIAIQKDGDIYNNVENNIELVCYNCRALR